MKLRILAIASAAVFVAACGSSKKSSHVAAHDVSYSGPTGAVTIATPAQAATVASGAYTSVGQVTGVGSFTSVGGVESAPARTVLDVARLVSRAAPKLAAAQVTGATQSGSEPCSVSGSRSGSVTMTDLDNWFTHTGDSATITFDRCNDGDGEVVDGTASIHIDSTVAGVDCLGDAPSAIQVGTYAVTVTFGDLTITTPDGTWIGMDGNITLSLTKRVSPNYELETSISGTSLAYATGEGSQLFEGALLSGPTASDPYLQKLVTRFATSAFTAPVGDYTTINGKMCSTVMGGCLSVVTVTPVYDPYGPTHPTDGLLVLRSGNAELIFDVLNATSVDVGYDNDVTVEPTPLGTLHLTWTCLEANNCQAN